MTNLAPLGFASQSSTDYGGLASRGNDGNTDGSYFSGASVFHTGYQSGAWWQVDLGQACFIQDVRLWNRTDCCATRASNVQVYLDGVFVGTAAGVIGTPSTVPVNLTGQVVRVVNGFVGLQWFHLAEVQVFAQP